MFLNIILNSSTCGNSINELDQWIFIANDVNGTKCDWNLRALKVSFKTGSLEFKGSINFFYNFVY
jgi:hypothetical protein